MPAPVSFSIALSSALLLLVLLPGCAVTEPTDQDTQRVRTLIDKNPETPLTVLAKRLGVSDAAVLAALPEPMCQQVPKDQWRQLLVALAKWGKVQVIFKDAEHRFVYEAEGIGLSIPSPEYLHIGSEGLAIALRIDDLHSLWLIDKPAYPGWPQRGLIVCDDNGDELVRFMLLYETGNGFEQAWNERP